MLTNAQMSTPAYVTKVTFMVDGPTPLTEAIIIDPAKDPI